MSAYDNDPRVRRVNDRFFIVETDTGRCGVDEARRGEWFAGGRVDADSAPSNLTGPYPSPDEAIASLIGDPR